MGVNRVPFPPNWRHQYGDRTSVVTESDWPQILAENALLRKELSFLRAELDAENAVDPQDNAPGGGRGNAYVQAHTDLLAFVLRLSESPAAALLRRWPGYRALEDRYLAEAQSRWRR